MILVMHCVRGSNDLRIFVRKGAYDFPMENWKIGKSVEFFNADKDLARSNFELLNFTFYI